MFEVKLSRTAKWIDKINTQPFLCVCVRDPGHFALGIINMFKTKICMLGNFSSFEENVL